MNVKGVFMKEIKGKGYFLLLLKIIHCVFEGEKENPDSDDHLVRALSES